MDFERRAEEDLLPLRQVETSEDAVVQPLFPWLAVPDTQSTEGEREMTQDVQIVKEGDSIKIVGLEPEHEDLAMWWLQTSADDFVAAVPKISEYGGMRGTEGAADLRMMGDAIATLLGWGVFTQVALEMACWFYLLGKIGRLVSDYQQERPGKQDTWHDISVYAMMARRIQETSHWP